MRGIPCALAVALAAGLVAAPAAGQPTDPAREAAERPGEEREAQERAARAAEASALLPALGADEAVTYAEVLARPDHIPTNFRYAQTLIRRGELRGAAATLQRILLVEPRLAAARMLYGVVLFRLDDLVEAERQFRELLTVADLPAGVRQEAERYLEEIERRRQRTRVSMAFTVGTVFDSNVNSAPRSEEVLVGGAEFDLDKDAQAQPDLAFVGIVEAAVEHELPTEAGHLLTGSVEYFVQEQGWEDAFDLQSVQVEGGGVLRTSFADLRPEARFSFLSLSDESFLRSYGGGLEAWRRVRADTDVYADLDFAYRDYEDVGGFGDSSQYTGFVWSLAGGAVHDLGPQHRLRAEIRFLDRHARKNWWSYRGVRLSLGHSWFLGGGQFLSTRTSYEHDWYERSNPSVDPGRKRTDDLWRTRVTYGTPLGRIFAGLRGLEDVLGTLSAEYFRGASNITNYDYQSWKVTLLFTKRWRP